MESLLRHEGALVELGQGGLARQLVDANFGTAAAALAQFHAQAWAQAAPRGAPARRPFPGGGTGWRRPRPSESISQAAIGEKRSVLFNSGAEAVENSIKIARSYTCKPAVVAFDHAYHGRTNMAMALTAKSMPYKSGFGPFAPEIYRAPLSYPYRDGLLDKELATDGELAAERAINVIDKQVGAANLAAILIEPIQGEGGFIVPAEGFLPALLEWCRNNDVVFIADEVQTGFARTGAMFACEHEGIEPDLIVTAKAIADGFPLSAVTGRAEIMDAPHVGGLGGTFGGNPVACAAALATIETIESDGLIERAQQLERLITEPLLRLQAGDDRIGDVRGRGAMIAVELVKSGTADPDAELTEKLATAVHAAGVIVLTCGMFGNIIRLLPPLNISDELLTEGIEILGRIAATSDPGRASPHLRGAYHMSGRG